ncbi:MAG: hypothetical protein GY898_04195 [Proteobacteria bacterium]|nr:hypothetical protein [Pseudomonadota bacterium]
MSDIVDQRIARLELDEDGFVHLQYKPGVTSELSDVQEFATIFQQLARGRAYLLSDLALKGSSSEGRAYAATAEYAENLHAVAAYGMSRVGVLVATVFLRLQRPRFPMRIFATEEDARAWLRKVRGDNVAA